METGDIIAERLELVSEPPLLDVAVV